jgi:hypothetical protein
VTARGAIRQCLVILLGAAPLAAQRAHISLDVGTASLQFADSIGARSTSLSPSLLVAGPLWRIGTTGTISQLSGAWTRSGRVDATFTPGASRRISPELSLQGGGSSHSNGMRTGQWLGAARLYMAGPSRGLWAGGGVGSTWDGTWREIVQADAGVWATFARSTISAALSPTVVDDTIRYADGLVALHSERRNWDFDGSLGFRSGNPLPTLPANRNVWGQVTAIFWASPRVGIVGAAGIYPVDFTQGFPGGRYVSVAVRVRSTPRLILAPLVATTTRTVQALQITTLSGNTRSLRVRAEAADRVELMADFTGWVPIAMQPDGGGWWKAVVDVPRGTHELNVRVDGGQWLAPPGSIIRTDEFGGVIGVIVVR